MHRFFVAPSASQQDRLVLEAREAHHAFQVLRLRPGARVVALDGAGKEMRCEVTEASKRQVALRVTHAQVSPRLPYQITLAQAVPKGRSMDWIIQKATELGVARIVPLLSERTVTRLSAAERLAKRRKWEQTALESLKQCGAAWLPRIEEPLLPDQFLQSGEEFDLSMIGSLQTDARHPRDYFLGHRQQGGAPPRTVCLWVGPEGDFTPSELNTIKSRGALPITLGPLVLRSETAAIYCVSVAAYELQFFHFA